MNEILYRVICLLKVLNNTLEEESMTYEDAKRAEKGNASPSQKYLKKMTKRKRMDREAKESR